MKIKTLNEKEDKKEQGEDIVLKVDSLKIVLNSKEEAKGGKDSSR